MSSNAVSLQRAVQQQFIDTDEPLEKQQLIDVLNRFNYLETSDVRKIIPLINNYLHSIKSHPKCSDYLSAADELLSKLSPTAQQKFYMQMNIIEGLDEESNIWRVLLLMQTGNISQAVTQLETPQIGTNGLGSDEYNICLRIVTEFNLKANPPDNFRPKAYKVSTVTKILSWKPVVRTQSVPAEISHPGTPLAPARCNVGSTSIHSTSTLFPKKVQFDKTQMSGPGKITNKDGESSNFSRVEIDSGNSIALVNATIKAPGTYEFTYVIELDRGASTCIGVAPESIKDKHSLDAITRQSKIFDHKLLYLIRSFAGKIYKNGKPDDEKQLTEFWINGSSIGFTIVVDGELAQVYITINGVEQLQGKAVFSDLPVPLKPFVACYSGMEKKLHIIHGKFIPKDCVSEIEVATAALNAIHFTRPTVKVEWPLNVQFDITQHVGSITFSQKNNEKWIERNSDLNDIGICLLNCVCDGAGFYRFTFKLEDKSNGTCMGFCLLSELDKFKSEFSTMTTEALFDSKHIYMLRLNDAKVFSKGRGSTLGDHKFIPSDKVSLVFELEVSRDKTTQISMEVPGELSTNIKNDFAEIDQIVVPFIAFFGKGKQRVMLSEAPIFIPVE